MVAAEVRDAVHVQDLFNVSVLHLHTRVPAASWAASRRESCSWAQRKSAGQKGSEKTFSCSLWVLGYLSMATKVLLTSHLSTQ